MASKTSTQTFSLTVKLTAFSLLIWLTGCMQSPIIATIAQPAPTVRQLTTADCLNHDTTADAFCNAQAAMLLASTVRFEIYNWWIQQDGVGAVKRYGVGHGTVKDGRYLVTHNHFSSVAYGGERPESASLVLFNADGEQIALLSGIELKAVEISAETLIIDFGDVNGQGYFDTLNIPSASFAPDNTVLIESNEVVAQINWDDTRSFIDWTKIRTVENEDGVLTVVLDNEIVAGASGGGIFLNGQHIANNWKSVQLLGAAGELVDAYSVAALND